MAINLIFENTNFVSNNVTFEVSGTLPDSSYQWYLQSEEYGTHSLTPDIENELSSTDFVYDVSGEFYPAVRILNDTNIFYQTSATIKINPKPRIRYVGATIKNGDITFSDSSNSLYFKDTIVSAIWNFGDGNTSSTDDISDSFVHSFSDIGIYNVVLSAIDINGNISTSLKSIPVLSSTYSEYKPDLITLYGPEEARWGNNKLIDLVNFLPNYLRGSTTEDFLKIFETFLNEMFTGNDGFVLGSDSLVVQSSAVSGDGITDLSSIHDHYYYDLDTSRENTDSKTAEKITFNYPANYDQNNKKISILEKIKRLTELQDPELIDLEYIQFFAKNLGYNVDIYRDEVVGDQFGNLAEIDNGSSSISDQQKYLRFVVQNLPNWYKIKTTKNCIKVMLYSFGLIGDLVEYYTKDYSNINDNWKIADEDYNNLKQEWYSTPHFSILINIDRSTELTLDVSRRESIIRAIESVKPINTVFRKLSGEMYRTIDVYISGLMRMSRYIEIKSTDEYPSDYFYS